MKISSKIVFTFLIPTYNSQKYIRRCLASIEKQNFNKKEYEVYIIDGGSEDNTLSIVETFRKKLPIKTLNNKMVDAESGKYQGIQKSKGEIIVLLDSDNEVVHKNWLREAQKVFQKHTDVWGIESPWLVNKKDRLINQYFSMMTMTDPIARLFKPVKEMITDMGTYEIITVKSTDTPVTGANGFFWRRNIVNAKINKTNKFEETNYVSFLVSSGNIKYVRLKYYGIYHYYCHSISNYIQKRKKVAKKFIARKARHQKTWVDKVGPVRFIISVIYNASIIFPAIEALINIARTRNIAWIYHPLISFITVVIYSMYYFKRTLLKK